MAARPVSITHINSDDKAFYKLVRECLYNDNWKDAPIIQEFIHSSFLVGACYVISHLPKFVLKVGFA